jgi:hypothetical protein
MLRRRGIGFERVGRARDKASGRDTSLSVQAAEPPPSLEILTGTVI